MDSGLERLQIIMNKGVFIDPEPITVPSGYASDARHVRFQDNKAQKMPGWSAYYASAFSSTITGVHAFDYGTTPYVIAGTGTKLSKIVSGVKTDFTPTYTGTIDYPWNFTHFGKILVCNNGKEEVLSSSPGYTTMASMVVNTNKYIFCDTIRCFQRHLVAIKPLAGTSSVWSSASIVEADYPYTVAWSDIDVYDDWIPGTDDEAGSIVLYESGKPIVGGDCMRDVLVVYTGDQIHTFQYIGGTYIFSRRIISYKTGLWKKKLLATSDDYQFFMGRDG